MKKVAKMNGSASPHGYPMGYQQRESQIIYYRGGYRALNAPSCEACYFDAYPCKYKAGGFDAKYTNPHSSIWLFDP